MNNGRNLWIVEVEGRGRWWPIYRDHVYSTRQAARDATHDLREMNPKEKYRYRRWDKQDMHP